MAIRRKSQSLENPVILTLLSRHAFSSCLLPPHFPFPRLFSIYRCRPIPVNTASAVDGGCIKVLSGSAYAYTQLLAASAARARIHETDH